MAKRKPARQFRRKVKEGGFTFEVFDGQTDVYRGTRKIGTLVTTREANGRYCFRLSCDRRANPRTYRGRVKAAEALWIIDQLVREAKTRRLALEEVIVRAWERKPEAAPH